LIFAANTGEIGWNGFYDGKAAPSDVYFYLLKITDTLGEQSHLKGTVHLLK
jgi:hypothetical protein